VRQPVDLIVVGAGLAGAAVAWAAEWRGLRVALIDSGDTDSASRVAAGLLTPVTGPRLTVDVQLTEQWASACAHYRRVEAATGCAILEERVAVRCLADSAEAERWARRQQETSVVPWLRPLPFDLVAEGIAAEYGAFAMAAAQLDTQAYLDATWAHFSGLQRTIDWTDDVHLETNRVIVAGLEARAVISCEGVLPAGHPCADGIAFRPARGDILTVRFSTPLPRHTLHRGLWIAPAPAAGLSLVGATYDFDDLDIGPSPTGRDDLQARLRAFVPRDFEVLDHRAGVRPILVGRKPVARWIDASRQLGVLTGLGSKGALTAPGLATGLVEGC
jgi:glycine/D-amino acid oxidase-like deaminating enzyme